MERAQVRNHPFFRVRLSTGPHVPQRGPTQAERAGRATATPVWGASHEFTGKVLKDTEPSLPELRPPIEHARIAWLSEARRDPESFTQFPPRNPRSRPKTRLVAFLCGVLTMGKNRVISTPHKAPWHIATRTHGPTVLTSTSPLHATRGRAERDSTPSTSRTTARRRIIF